MIDGLVYNDQVKNIVKKQLGIDEDEDINKVSVDDINGDETPVMGDHIAVYYAYGDIVDKTTPQGIFQSNHQIV